MESIFQRKRILLLHLSFWLVYLSFNLYQVSVFQQARGYDWYNLITNFATQLIFTMLIAYFNYFYLLPQFQKHRNPWRYAWQFLVPFMFIIASRIVLQRYLIDGYTQKVGYFYSSFFVVQVISITLFIVFFVGMLRFASDWFELEAKKKELANEKLLAELNFLKAQINPHFLFNTLNNLYYLAFSKSDNATVVIDKLSQMMRYMIYDSNHPTVPLSKEIDYMNNYISLERLRLNDEVDISFAVEGRIEKMKIVPLILITFLENAFKHGMGNQHGAYVKAMITVEGETCTYTVENSLGAGTGEKQEKSGIGLQNVRRRLALSYPDRYELKIDDSDNRYLVQLKLTLS